MSEVEPIPFNDENGKCSHCADTDHGDHCREIIKSWNDMVPALNAAPVLTEALNKRIEEQKPIGKIPAIRIKKRRGTPQNLMYWGGSK